MESKGVSGYKLAKATQISESLFSKWRGNPTSDISANTLGKIAEYFHVSIDCILGRESKMIQQTEKILLDDKEEEIIISIRNKKISHKRLMDTIEFLQSQDNQD